MVSFELSTTAFLALDALDENLRQICDGVLGQSWTPQQKTDFISLLQMAYEVPNRRNVQLWLTLGSTRRRFLRKELDDYQFMGRLTLLLALYTPIENFILDNMIVWVGCPMPPDDMGPTKLKDLTHENEVIKGFQFDEYVSHEWRFEEGGISTFGLYWVYGASNLPSWLPDYLRPKSNLKGGTDDWEGF